MMKLYAPFIREATLRVTMTLRSEGHGGDPSPKLQGAIPKTMATLSSTKLVELTGGPWWGSFAKTTGGNTEENGHVILDKISRVNLRSETLAGGDG